MRFSRHAKNWARRRDFSIADAEKVIAHPIYADRDRKGKPRYTGEIRGIRVRIVVALDEPSLIVTIHERRR
jgi:Domain of unknown function (DUF4258)